MKFDRIGTGSDEVEIGEQGERGKVMNRRNFIEVPQYKHL